jgi:hypothetical protein
MFVRTDMVTFSHIFDFTGKFATDGTSKVDLGAAAFPWPV